MVAERLKELRTARKLTQNDISALLNISWEAYSMYENNKRQLNYESLCVISNFYHVSLDYLFGQTDNRELPAALSKEETALLIHYRESDMRGQENIRSMARLEYDRNSNALNPDFKL